MQKIIIFDTEERHDNLLPLTYTRAVADLRVGITTLKEKWEHLLDAEAMYLTVEHLREHYGELYYNPDDEEEHLFVSGDVVADENIAEHVKGLETGGALIGEDGGLVAMRGTIVSLRNGEYLDARPLRGVRRIKYVFDIFLLNGEVLREDYRRLTNGKESQSLSVTNTVIGAFETENGEPNIFIEEGASVEGTYINVTEGPVYIGRNAKVMEGSCLRGPLALCDNSTVRMGAKVYGKTTLGPYCKVGGEIDNVVFIGYSNKAHDGYLGNSVIGEWCNIGAGVNASNLKNNYAKIRVWNYALHTFMRTDLQFCGLIMGDHSKIGINCMLNTATVIGVGVNLHGAGFPRVFIPSFSEGSPAGGFGDVRLKDFFVIAERVMSRREKVLTDADQRMFERIFEKASNYKR